MQKDFFNSIEAASDDVLRVIASSGARPTVPPSLLARADEVIE